MDGEAGGRIKCSLGNWDGIAYKIPKTELGKCGDTNYLQQSGVYFLFGTDEKGDQTVYVGQAGSRKNGKGLLLRVQEPHNSIDWTETIMFTKTNNSLGPTEISYLENRFCNLAKEAGSYKVKNGNEPNSGNITEEAESEMEEFVDYAKIIMSVLGHKVFEPLKSRVQDAEKAEPPITQSLESAKDEPLFYMEYKKGRATGRRTCDGFVILKGSTINPATTKSCPERVLEARKKYADKINDNYELTADILMTSASAAAGFVGGSSLSGNALWHEEETESLLYMKYKEGKAVCRRTRDGFVILKGSTINPATTKSCPERVLKARRKYADKINDKYELTADILFTSASTAAEFVGGASLNGKDLWHDKRGKTLKELEG